MDLLSVMLCLQKANKAKNRKQEGQKMKKGTLNFVAGMITGAVLFSGGAAYAAGIMAEHAPQTAYLDGAPIQMDAYNIGGYNYVKLRHSSRKGPDCIRQAERHHSDG